MAGQSVHGNAISIHSPHARGDAGLPCRPRAGNYFNPLPSCEGRPVNFERLILLCMISIHSPHARGDVQRQTRNRSANIISIHSPHARGDGLQYRQRRRRSYFNPLPSCEGRRGCCGTSSVQVSLFQSTPLMRGETIHTHGNIGVTLFQSTPLMRGETALPIIDRNIPCISIHSPHARGDMLMKCVRLCRNHFNPLPSCEGRLYHAGGETLCLYFNPLPSCEGRQTIFDMIGGNNHFNPLPSCEGRLSSAAPPHAVQ